MRPGSTQVTSNVVMAVSPALTNTVRGFSPPTPQFDSTAISSTVWSPGVSPSTVTDALTASD